MYSYIKISHKYTYQYILRIFKHIQLLEQVHHVLQRGIYLFHLFHLENSSFADN